MADAETAKYTVIGYRRAIEYLDQARALDCAGVDARLALCYSLWARDRKYLLLPNTDQWASGFHYARLALRGGRTSEAVLATAVAESARNFIDEHEYSLAYSSTQMMVEGDADAEEPAAGRLALYLRDLFTGYADRTDAAMGYVEEALKANPADPDALLVKWLVETPGAEESPDLPAIMQQKPDCVIVYYELAAAKMRAGWLREAQHWLNETLKRNPDHPRALADLGEVAMKNGLQNEALDLLQRAVRIDPELPQAQFDLGNIGYETGEAAEAESRLREAARLRSDWGEPLDLLATVLTEEERWTDAAEVLTRLIALQDNLELIAYCRRALCNLWLERLDEAEADCRSAIATNENIDAPYYLLGVIALRRGDAKSAAGFCTKALTINAAHADAHLCLGQALARLQKPDEARNNIARARELYLSQIATIEGNIRDETGRGRVWQVKKLEKERDRIKENVAICDELQGEKPLAVSH